MSEQCNSPGELHLPRRSRHLSLPPHRRASALRSRRPGTRIALAFDRERQPAQLARTPDIG